MKILYSGQKGFNAFAKKFHQRGALEFEKIEGVVRGILKQIRSRGDDALVSFTQKFDGWRATSRHLRVSHREIQSAVRSLRRQDLENLTRAARRIERFHLLQKQNSWLFAEEDGNLLGQILRPMNRVGIYVPGGKAAYPSSVLMNALPPKVAGVPEIIMTCPAPGGEINPVVLAAASICGVKDIFKVGGAQAIGALAWGTPTIPKVDKICGPGNIFVTLAKNLVFGVVDIDGLAGPSEVLIIADDTAELRKHAARILDLFYEFETQVTIRETARGGGLKGVL